MLPTNRARMRARLEKARATLRLARFGDPAQRVALVSQALRELLTIVGSAGEIDPLPEGEALERGAERVSATLVDTSLASTLAAFLDVRQLPAPESGTIDEIARLCQWTDWLIDLRSDRERRFRRRLLRLGAVVAVVLVAYAAIKDKNLALHRPVTASSIGGFTPEALPGKGRLERLVDGERVEHWMVGVLVGHGMYGGGTERQLHPWITIDLGRVHKINEVVVYNRSDCCWGVADVPVALQLSNDNRTFVTVATRQTEFDDDFPWRQAVGGRRARYVRLWSPSETPKELVLSEIEVYGR